MSPAHTSELIDDLTILAGSGRLTTWEESFVSELAGQAVFTEKQEEKIAEIHGKYVT